jgi:hypothetical protein
MAVDESASQLNPESDDKLILSGHFEKKFSSLTRLHSYCKHGLHRRGLFVCKSWPIVLRLRWLRSATTAEFSRRKPKTRVWKWFKSSAPLFCLWLNQKKRLGLAERILLHRLILAKSDLSTKLFVEIVDYSGLWWRIAMRQFSGNARFYCDSPPR